MTVATGITPVPANNGSRSFTADWELHPTLKFFVHVHPISFHALCQLKTLMQLLFLSLLLKSGLLSEL